MEVEYSLYLPMPTGAIDENITGIFMACNLL
jgi:hypothetical protein